VQVREQNAAKQAEKQSQEVYIPGMRGDTSKGRISIKLGNCVRLQLIERAKLYLNNSRTFPACFLPSFPPSLTPFFLISPSTLFYRAASDYNIH